MAAAATVWVVDALLVVLACNACAVSAALDSVADAGGCVSAATTWLAPTVLVDVVGVVAFTVAGCVEFDSVSAGFEVVGSGFGAWVSGGVLDSAGSVVSSAGSLESGGVSTPLVSSSGSVLVGVGAVGAVDASDSAVLVCAPPLLLMVTPGATCSDDDVAPDVVLLDEVVSAPVDVESAPVVAVDAAADSVDDSPADVSLDVEFAELVDDDSEDVPVVSAAAKPGEVITIAPIPRAAANAPTRPT
jgi:hypothetical protein